MALLRSLGITLEMIKWEHSIFALPFALCGAMLAAGGLPTGRQLLWIIVCMVSARSAAMAFNRLVDEDVDKANPRTATRALPAGLLSRSFVVAFVVLWCAVFVLAATQLNRLTLYLSPAALAIVLFYSYTKRFTRWSHLVLGFALGIAPTAAWIAVRGELDPRILILTCAVTLWVGGFDILYACQDLEFDRGHGLRSIPARFGVRKSIALSRAMHVATVLVMATLWRAAHLPALYLVGVTFVAVLLAYEQSLVRADDLSQVKKAFDLNGYVGIVYFATTALALYLG